MIRYLVFTVFALVAIAPLGAAQAPAQDQRRSVAIALQTGDFDTAREIVGEQGSDLDRVFLEGLILQRQNKHREAADLFRQVLQVRPAERAIRQSLIRSLVALEEYDGALFQVDELIETEPDEDRRKALQNVRRNILSRRPYGFSAGFSLTPSTNVNRATANESVDFNDQVFQIDETDESGLGVTVTFRTFRRFELENGNAVQLDASSSATLFDTPDFNRGALNGSVAYINPVDDGLWRGSFTLNRNIYNDSNDNNTRFILSGLRRWQQNERLLWDFSLSGYYTNFSADVNDRFDGYTLDGSVALRRRISPTLSVNGSVGLGFGNPEDNRFRYIGKRAGVGLTRSWQTGWRVSGGLNYEIKDFDEDFSGFGVREDQTYGASISVLNSNIRWRGAVPNVRCSASRTNSNIAFYDNRNVVECNLALTQRF